MSEPADPVLDFLTRWLLEFGVGSDNGQRHTWQAYRDTKLALGQKPLLELFESGKESRFSSQCSYKISQAGLDYIKRGGKEA